MTSILLSGWPFRVSLRPLWGPGGLLNKANLLRILVRFSKKPFLPANLKSVVGIALGFKR